MLFKPKPLFEFTQTIDIKAPPEKVFSYLIDPEKYKIWCNYDPTKDLESTDLTVTVPMINTDEIRMEIKKELEVKKGRIQTSIEYLNPDQPVAQGSEFLLRVDNSFESNMKEMPPQYGVITHYEPPYYLTTELRKHAQDKNKLFDTISITEYSLEKTKEGTQLKMHATTDLRFDEARVITNTVLRIIVMFVPFVVYLIYRFFKKLFVGMVMIMVQKVSKGIFAKLKAAAESEVSN